MSRTGILILTGILIILTPFSGLPISIRSILLVIFGVVVLSIGFYIRSSEANKIIEDKKVESQI